jgi:hypothetical protein
MFLPESPRDQFNADVRDVAMKPEMIHHAMTCRTSHVPLLGVHAGRLHPHHGAAPSFWNNNLLDQIPASAVTFHRCKDGSLIEKLRERKMDADQMKSFERRLVRN